MAAYAAVNSLKNTIQHIRDSSRISFVPEMITDLVYKELQPLEEILQRLDRTSKSKSRKKVNVLDEQIKEAIWKFEDLLELHIISQLATQFESPLDQLKLTSMSRNVNRQRARRRRGRIICDYSIALCSNKLPEEEEAANQIFFIDLHGLQHDVGSFVETVRDMEKKYIYELDNLPEDEDEDEEESAVSSLRIDCNGKKSKMVGFFDEFKNAKYDLVHRSERRRAYSLIGMAGIGKTTLAKELFHDPLIRSHFDCHVWVTIGRKSIKFKEILRCIVAQVDPNYMVTSEGNDEVIVEWLKERLKEKKCLIVLDDVWETQVWDLFTCILMPDENSGVGNLRILLTARERIVAGLMHRSMNGWIQLMRFLDKEESEELLCAKVFGEGTSFPPELEKAGKKIAENCEGLPLMIVTVADHLSKVDKDPEYWNEVAEKRNSVFVDAYDKIYKVLLPSYEYLPQHLKLIFLYIGMFRQDYEIPVSNLINLLISEGFVKVPADTRQTPVVSIMECLSDLVTWHNLVITIKRTMHWFMKILYTPKSCRLHSAWRHLCKREAGKNKSFHVLNCRGLEEEEGIQGERRLCVYSNNLLAIKQVCNSVQSADCASTARSLLCLGPYHQYPVPILDVVGFKLLRVLDALKVRFYQFPIQILKLVQLRYLALTYNKNLPPSISKLFNLQFLIIHPHTNIKICGDPLLIPVQIWDMKELKHIEIMGSSLPNPTSDAALMEQLSTLVAMSATSCTREVLGKIPNLRKLGIQIEWGNSPEDDRINPLSCFDHISKLENLETLKCSVMNPKVGIVAPLNPLSTLPSRLQKLHLSGLGYPWECMKAIGSLPNLEVLKLRCYAFRGPNWEAEENSFLSLEFLLIEDTDLVQWSPGNGSFPVLSNLIMKHCYKLQKLQYWPSNFHMGRIELDDCNPLVVTCANRLHLNTSTKLRVIAPSSFHG